ncbi:MAG: crossover junction endodeoxyribonuclease RuvC [Treponemataceae bacterium]|nr:crossover junction endodeoxyribonuclease RuvC [Treponemataceae bacterium]
MLRKKLFLSKAIKNLIMAQMGNQDKRRILGIDPGLASTGWGVIESDGIHFKLIDYGCIETESSMEHGKRLVEIYNIITNVINDYKPTESSMETLYFAKNVTSAMSVSQARGVVTLALTQNNLSLGEYTPNAIKQSVTGTATANKKLVQGCVKMLLGMDHIPKPDHSADALAVAITHATSSHLTRNMETSKNSNSAIFRNFRHT